MAFGGNFYAITPAADAGLVVDPARNGELIEAGLAVMAAINAVERPVHPEDPRISGCHHVVFHEPGRDGADARAATSIHPGWLDRSPCGTGTSARMAQLHARGELALGDRFVNESVIGTRFTGRLVEETTVGGRAGGRPGDHRPGVDHGHGPVPARRDDPFPAGFALSLDERRGPHGLSAGADGPRGERRASAGGDGGLAGPSGSNRWSAARGVSSN